MRSMSQLFLLLLILAPLATAEWVRFEAEDAVLSSTHAVIVDNTDASGGKVVSLNNAAPAGTIDFTVNIREPNTLGTAMRVGFRANFVGDQKYDNYYVNNLTTTYLEQNWACDYYWDPAIKPANFENYRNSIGVYGIQTQFQLLSRWWAAWDDNKKNIPMTVPLVAGKNTIRIQSAWSETSYDYIELNLPEMAYDPDPADGDTEVRSTQTTLSWDNPADTTKNVIYFGQSDTEPNVSNYQSLLTTVITLNNPDASPSIAMPTLVDGKNYYWVVDSYDMPSGDPNFPGVIWSFSTQFNAAPDISIEAPYAYLGQGGVPGQVTVPLDATVSEPCVSYEWKYISGAVSSASLAPDQMTGMERWWGDTLFSAAVAGDACRYSLTLVDPNNGWGELIRVVNWGNTYGFQVGETWKQEFVSPAENLYSIEVVMYYTVEGSAGGSVSGIVEPGETLTLSLNISSPVQWYGLEFATGYEKGLHPTTPGTTGSLVVDVFQDADPVLPVINSPNTEDTTVTIFSEGHPLVFELVASDGIRSGTGRVSFYVDDTACEAALRKPGQHDMGDINNDCMVDMSDFSIMASKWLNCIDTVTGNNCN